jgi:hypothetical protein
MILFAASTGLRPSDLFALEHRDFDRGAGVVQIRRAYANGRVKHTKTRLLSRRAVPLQAIALNALDQLPKPKDSPLLFPNARGGYLDFRNFNRRHWKPVQKTVGIEPLRDLYDLRHTYATFALRVGVPVFALSRFMGTSIALIDLHYGHLAVDSYEDAVSLMDALALERAVDAGWTSARIPAKQRHDTVPNLRGKRSWRAVDARWTPRPEPVASSPGRRNCFSSKFAKPSDGLEPSNPSLPFRAPALFFVDRRGFGTFLDVCLEATRVALRSPPPVPKTSPQIVVALSNIRRPWPSPVGHLVRPDPHEFDGSGRSG